MIHLCINTKPNITIVLSYNIRGPKKTRCQEVQSTEYGRFHPDPHGFLSFFFFFFSSLDHFLLLMTGQQS